MALRLDKFIWSVRLSKTRSIATELISKGKIKINGTDVKPSKEVKVNDVINISKNSALFSYKVKALIDKRIGPKLVVDFIEDITPLEEVEKFKLYNESQSVYRQYGTGKPTKKDRRSLDDFLDF